MARFCSEDGAISMAVGPVFTGDSPSKGRSRPLVASLLLLPVRAAARTDNIQLLTLSVTHAAVWPQCWRRAPSSGKRKRGPAPEGFACKGDDAADALTFDV